MNSVPETRGGISVVFPAYNDAHTIGGLVKDAFDVLRVHADKYEVIVVNDGSRDGTAGILAELEREYAPHLRIVTHPRNRGYGGALLSGFAAASMDFVFYTDGDGQYDVKELPALLQEMRSDVCLVNGYKVVRRDPRHRIWIGGVYNAFCRLFFGLGIRDVDCDFRLIRRTILQEADLQSTSGTICIELVHALGASGYRMVEVGVSHYPRLHGSSQFFRVGSLLKTFQQLLGLYCRLVLLAGSGITGTIGQPCDSPSSRRFT